ncbi:WD40 repeat domain-containing protein [Streptomyces inhibens]|uniref:WD40 repeat domain-containing protein n=1 Tax=Streptomyces inhibens TaxID=2293571 RepID=UPI0037A17DEC
MALALEAARLAQTSKVAAALNRLRSPHPVTHFEIGSAPVRALGFGGEGRFLIGGDTSGRVRVWDTYTGRTRLSAQVQGAVTEAVVNYGADLAAARGARGGVRVWDLSTGRLVRTFASAPGRAAGLTFVPKEKGRLAFGGRGGTVEVWDTETWSRTTTLHPVGGSVALTWFPDGDVFPVLASLSPHGSVDAWDLDNGRRLGTVRIPVTGKDPATVDYVLDAHGDDQAVVSDGMTTWVVWLKKLIINDWPTPDFRPLGRTVALPSAMGSNRLVAADSKHSRVMVWGIDPVYPPELPEVHYLFSRSIVTHGSKMTALVARRQSTGDFGPDAPPERLSAAVALADGSVTLWDLAEGAQLTVSKQAIQDELFQLCSGTPLILTPQEWKKLIPELPYAPACVEVMKQREGGHD